MNYTYYEGKGISTAEVIDLAETMPFFAERRLIVIENSGFFKNAAPELADYLKNLPETAYFLFVESEVDKRGKMYKAVKEKGRIVELSRQDEKTILYWIAGNVKKEGMKIKETGVLDHDQSSLCKKRHRLCQIDHFCHMDSFSLVISIIYGEGKRPDRGAVKAG